MVEAQNVTPVQPPSQGIPTAPQKKTSPWVWVIGGCVVLLVLGGLAFAGCTYFGYRTVKKYGNDVNSIYLNTINSYSNQANYSTDYNDTNTAADDNTVSNEI